MDTPTVRGHETFRTVLGCFARPGTLGRGGADGVEALERLAECLMDAETSLGAVGPAIETLAGDLARRSGARLLPPERADFVLVGAGCGAVLRALRTGSPDYPDRGATVVYLVRKLAGEGGDWTWSGPGIPGAVAPRIEGLGGGELEEIAAANASYPLGLDALFVDDGGWFLALPRSTRLERRA